MKRLSTTLDFSCSITNPAKKLFVVIIAFLPFISWGQQQQGSNSPLKQASRPVEANKPYIPNPELIKALGKADDYRLFGGDTLNGLDLQKIFDLAAANGYNKQELEALMRKEQRLFVFGKYSKFINQHLTDEDPLKVLSRYEGNEGHEHIERKALINKPHLINPNVTSKPLIIQNPDGKPLKKPEADPCNNISFATGDYTDWGVMFGYNDYAGGYTLTNNPNFGATGGIYNGPSYPTTGYLYNGVAPDMYNTTNPPTLGVNSPVSSCSWVTIMNSSGPNDPYATGTPITPVPPGGTYSCRLGGDAANVGPGFAPTTCGTTGHHGDDDGTDAGNPVGQAEALSQEITVTKANALLTIQFAAVINDGGHPAGEQPFVYFEIIDGSGNVNPCYQYYQEATSGTPPPGYYKSTVQNTWAGPGNYTNVWVQPWRYINFDLTPYIGQTIQLQAAAVGCYPGGHFAYMYMTGTCGPVTLPVVNSSSTCNSATITAPPGDSAYHWTTSAGAGCITSGANSQTVTVACSGTYSVDVILQGGAACSYQLDTTVTINVTPTITASAVSPTICSGGSGTTLNANGAGAGGTYTWTPSTGLSSTTGSSVTANPAGTTTYTVTGTNSSGLCSNTATVKVTVNTTPTVTSINVNPTPTVCAGTLVTLSANGGTTYAWSPATGLSATSGASVTVTPTTTVTYSVTTTTGGCTSAAATTTITVNPTPTATASAGSGTICAGQSTQLTAAPSGLSYSWTPNVPVSLTNTSYDTTTASPTVTTVYTVIVTDANGCTNSASPATVTVNVNSSPTVSVSSSVPSDSICSGNSITLTANGSAGYSYSWSPGGATTSSITVSPTTTTTYVVTAFTSIGCTGGANATATAVVTVTPTPTLTVGPSSTVTICPGDSAQLTASGATTYSWSTGATTSSIWVSPTDTTIYTVSGANGNCGSSGATNITVNVGKLTVTLTSSGGTTVCSGVPDTITAHGGASGYSWSTGATTSSIVVTPTVADTFYYVIGTSGLGCSDSAAITLKVNATPTVSSVSVNDSSGTVCPGDTTQAFVKDSGVGPYTYLWTPGGQTHDTAYGLTAGTYTVTVASANGCAALTTNTVTIKTQNIVVTATASGGGNICTGGSPTQLTATGANNYIWRTSAGLTDTIYDTTMAFPAGTTTYTVYGTTTGTCKDSATVTVTVNSTPTLTLNVGRDTAVCSGGSITLTASGATGYSWNTTPVQTTSSITVSPSSLTTYVVTGTGAGGCTATDTITVNVVPSPTVNINISGGNDTVCKGSSVTLTASGAPGNNYVWSPGGSTGASIKVTPATSPTTYTVTSTNGGCSVKTTQDVYIFPALNVNMLNAVDSGCSGQSVTIGVNVSGGSGPYAYVWSPNVGTGAGPYVVPAVPQTYTCTVTDACGSTASGTTLVIVTPSPTAKFNPEPADSVLAGGYISFVNQSTNATWYYWTFGDGGKDTSSFPYYQYNVEGTYTVTLVAVSKAGCRDTVDTVVHVKEWIFIPNVFTPNGDGINDVFHVTAASMKTYHIEIFNRWGERLFQADNPNIDWNGRSSSGVMESDGIYYYKITATDYAGHNYNLDGYVQLIGGGNVGGGQ